MFCWVKFPVWRNIKDGWEYQPVWLSMVTSSHCHIYLFYVTMWHSLLCVIVVRMASNNHQFTETGIGLWKNNISFHRHLWGNFEVNAIEDTRGQVYWWRPCKVELLQAPPSSDLERAMSWYQRLVWVLKKAKEDCQAYVEQWQWCCRAGAGAGNVQ